jgi:hypothetical protein
MSVELLSAPGDVQSTQFRLETADDVLPSFYDSVVGAERNARSAGRRQATASARLLIARNKR